MHLWIGLGMESPEEARIRACCKNANTLGVNEQAFLLPQHVSLKTSFETEQYPQIIAFMKEKYSSQCAISMEIEGVEQLPGILWLRVKENAVLRQIHSDLIMELGTRFGIRPQGFDGDGFAFHSTLFYDMEHPEQLGQLFRLLEHQDFFSKTVLADRLYFGISESGRAGTYRTVDSLRLK